jgi:hypothetical protein
VTVAPEFGGEAFSIGAMRRRATLSKMLADCELLYIPAFMGGAKMAVGFLL